MQSIEYASAFKKDYKRVKATPSYSKNIEELFTYVVSQLLEDTSLAPQYRDHTPTGNWAGYRQCHLKPDLLLIYKKPDGATLCLARLGSHSEFFR